MDHLITPFQRTSKREKSWLSVTTKENLASLQPVLSTTGPCFVLNFTDLLHYYLKCIAVNLLCLPCQLESSSQCPSQASQAHILLSRALAAQHQRSAQTWRFRATNRYTQPFTQENGLDWIQTTILTQSQRYSCLLDVEWLVSHLCLEANRPSCHPAIRLRGILLGPRTPWSNPAQRNLAPESHTETATEAAEATEATEPGGRPLRYTWPSLEICKAS